MSAASKVCLDFDGVLHAALLYVLGRCSGAVKLVISPTVEVAGVMYDTLLDALCMPLYFL